MPPKTRQGTQEANAIYKNSHSRGILSGIFNAFRDKTEGKNLLNKYMEDSRLRPSGMTPNLMSDSFRTYKSVFGFTLIELLVVILIIGILAAVAVPQYNKAVEKARIAEALPMLTALQQATQRHVLEYGVPEEDYINLLEDKSLDIDCNLDGPMVPGQACNSKNWDYWVTFGGVGPYCPAGFCIEGINNGYFQHSDGKPYQFLLRSEDGQSWEKICLSDYPAYKKPFGCTILENQGWTYSDAGF